MLPRSLGAMAPARLAACLVAFVLLQATSSSAFRVNQHTYHKSIMWNGDLSMFVPMAKKLSGSRPQCLKVVAVGGSVSCEGTTRKHANASWPTYLMDTLHAQFPCAGHHDVTIYCQPGEGADHWLEVFMGHMDEVLQGVDLAIIDTGLNDGLWDKKGPQTRVDLLMSMFLQRMRKPSDPSNLPTTSGRVWTGVAVMFLVPAGSIHDAPTVDGSVQKCEEYVWRCREVYLPIFMNHGIPWLDVIAGLMPFNTPDRVKFLMEDFIVDGFGHPGDEGQRFIADLTGKYIADIVASVNMGMPWAPASVHGYEEVYVPRAPTFTEPTTVEYYLTAHPLVMPASEMRLHQSTDFKWADCSSFKVMEERVVNLEANNVGATCSLIVRAEAVDEHFLSKIMNIRVLKSDEKLGKVKVEVFAGARKMAERLIDCLWFHTVSVSDLTELPIPDWPAESDMLVKFTVIPSTPARSKNRIKIYGVTLI